MSDVKLNYLLNVGFLICVQTEMWQIYEVWPSISPWKQNNITEILLFSPSLPSVSDNKLVKSICFLKSLSINCKFPLHGSTVHAQFQLSFTITTSLSYFSNNTNCSDCISIVSKRTQSKILLLLVGNSSIQILRDRSWLWAFATSFLMGTIP